MSVSLSQGEATAIVLKAARGFGLSWGLAEEAGWALCQLGQFGDDPLSWFDRAFNESKENCPITIGATVMDHAPLAGSLAQKRRHHPSVGYTRVHEHQVQRVLP